MNSNQIAANNMAVQMLMQRYQQQVESSARSNAARTRTTRTLAETVRLSSVSIPAEIRFMKHLIPGLKALNHAIEGRLKVLIEGHLKLIADKASAEEAKEARGRFMHECNVLRGDFSRLYVYADNESSRLVYVKSLAEKPKDNLTAPLDTAATTD